MAQVAVTERCRKNTRNQQKLGETNFRTWEFPRSGSKAEDGEEEKREKERKLVHGARKHAWRTQAAWAKNAPYAK